METLTFDLKTLLSTIGLITCVGIPAAILGLTLAGVDLIGLVWELLERRR